MGNLLGIDETRRRRISKDDAMVSDQGARTLALLSQVVAGGRKLVVVQLHWVAVEFVRVADAADGGAVVLICELSFRPVMHDA